MNSSPKERYTVGLSPDTLDVSHTCRTAVSSNRQIDVIKPPAPSSKRPPPRPAPYMDPFVHHRGHGATFVSDVSHRSKHLFSQPHNRVTPTGESRIKKKHLTTGKKILIGLVILFVIAVVVVLVLYFVLSQDGNDGNTSSQQVTEVVSVSYEGIVSITANPSCTLGETLDPSSVRFKAQEKLFCDLILIEVQSQNLTKDFDGCSVTENICEVDTSVRRRRKRQNNPRNLLKYQQVWRERVTYNKQDGFNEGRFSPATKNACIKVVSNVIQDSPNMEQVQAPETQEIILQPVIGVSTSTETEETPTPSLRPPVSLSSMTASTTSANTPGPSSSRTDETSSTIVEGSTEVFNVESSSIVVVYSTQFSMTMPSDLSTETLTSDAVSISHLIDNSPESEINILATNTERNTDCIKPPIMPTPAAESPTEFSTTDEVLTATMKATITALKASAAITPSEEPTATEATTLSLGLPSTTLETPATTVLATTTTEGPATATQISVITVSTTKTAKAMIITSTEASTTPTEATMPSTETTSMTAKAINLIQATTSNETRVTTDAATATPEKTTSRTEVLSATQITISPEASTATNELTAATADITTTIEAATTEENATVIPLTPSWSTCQGGLTGPNCEWTCGQPQVSASVACPRVVGGCEVGSNSWPFAAAYVTFAWEDNWDNYDMYYYLRCGAAVLSEYCAITAAHCQPLIGSAIVMGFHCTKDHPCPGAREENQHCQHRVITSRVFHENYTGGAYHDYDVVIVCWDEAVEFNEAIQPICLVSNNWDDQIGEVHKDFSKAYGIGWGKTELDDYADGLKQVALPLYSYAQCVERYGDPITEWMLCAGGTNEDTCQRDSGGPLVYKLDGAWYLIGLTSWGFECGNPDNPGGYVNVSNLVGWVEATLQTMHL